MIEHKDVIIVGAGPAGVGMASMLRRIGVEKMLLIDRYEVGASFIRWPQETRFITPSFYSNPFGHIDLNAVTRDSSPARSAGLEHLDGTAYAKYLQEVLQGCSAEALTSTHIIDVSLTQKGSFRLFSSSSQKWETPVLIWATGEYQFPDKNVFEGSEHCLHYSQVNSWSDFKQDDYVIIGGYESAIDAAINLLEQGCRVKLLTRSAPWAKNPIADPSISLSPWTCQRLQQVMDNRYFEIYEDADVISVLKTSSPDGGYRIHTANGRAWCSHQQPILGTGFLCGGGARQLAPFFDWNASGFPLLTPEDASTRFPGLYLVGPQVRHEQHIYCFIYKFRERFAVVAKAVARQLNLPLKDDDLKVLTEDICCQDESCHC
ncbi:NAD(P)/FAD-dependent oxidoreductase [Pantoea agglomerans]|uniref:NAD(P)/FAD-dependent oxidoreductase n=1 Tax=Enterobacter agglomerans TaxID=549 RepID=UPI0013BF3943|nr:NAD(P)/FAD-dependent oxidoreductase [Pantoea agglomerans]MBO0639798.1 NAD(P)-binding domain-containing protein [Pantoea agglomerans]NEH20483.1 thioredoxin reductase [Pantoea agglomerans]